MKNTSICVDLVSMRKLLEVIGGDIRRTENRETWLWRVSRTTGLHFRVIKAIFYGQQVSFESAYKLKQAAKKNDEYIIDRLLWSREVLRETDPIEFRDQINHLSKLVDVIRDLSSKRE